MRQQEMKIQILFPIYWVLCSETEFQVSPSTHAGGMRRHLGPFAFFFFFFKLLPSNYWCNWLDRWSISLSLSVHSHCVSAYMSQIPYLPAVALDTESLFYFLFPYLWAVPGCFEDLTSRFFFIKSVNSFFLFQSWKSCYWHKTRDNWR